MNTLYLLRRFTHNFESSSAMMAMMAMMKMTATVSEVFADGVNTSDKAGKTSMANYDKSNL
jgi:hypothetical protein